MRNFFYGLAKNLIKIFSGRNILWHFLAIALTYIIVLSGFDWIFFTHVVNVSWRSYFFPALAAGGILPVLVPLVLFLIYFFTKKNFVLALGLAETQAVMLGVFISSLYKAFTGRIQPPSHLHNLAADAGYLVDNSHEFQFGFLRHGVFWGWPSSHTTLAFAMATVIFLLFPKNKSIRIIALLYAFFVGIGVAVTSIHWFSEFIAGAIFGTLIGIIVGKSYLAGIQK